MLAMLLAMLSVVVVVALVAGATRGLMQHVRMQAFPLTSRWRTVMLCARRGCVIARRV
jgi:hypothetical protein